MTADMERGLAAGRAAREQKGESALPSFELRELTASSRKDACAHTPRSKSLLTHQTTTGASVVVGCPLLGCRLSSVVYRMGSTHEQWTVTLPYVVLS